LIGAIQQIVRGADEAIARVYLALRGERNGIISLLFHSLFRDEKEIALNAVDPLERTTISNLRQAIEYYLNYGYRFISPLELLGELDPNGKYALLTFDDGYYNNIHALPVLEDYRVPAAFFISTDHVRQNKCFWWDVLYRERRAQGAPHRKIYREALSMKSRRTDEIEAELTSRFGPEAFKPRGDLDRPFTPGELREFARSPYVCLGNHTANHAILTNYDGDEVRRQIRDAQDSLREMTGVTPSIIAYPNGAHDQRVIAACNEAGLKVGFTIRPQKNVIPRVSQSASLLQMGRFVLQGSDPIARQCRTFRSDVLLYGRFRDWYLSHANRPGSPVT
jgi:peptidoglycan/xylan/chitin deacetylase (PgdA/CDA1 family)